jgi:hypothetical protein
MLAENHWTAIRFHTCHTERFQASTKAQRAATVGHNQCTADSTTFAIHADSQTLLRHSASNHKRASRRAAIVQALGRRSHFQREHKEKTDTQIYIFEWFREEICRKVLASLLDKSTVL